MRGYVRAGIPEKIRAAGGEIYAVSSEPQALAARAARDWHLGFEAVGDPHHEIAGACRERGWLDLFVNERLGFLQASAGAADWTPKHPKGYFQPGVLAVDRGSRVLYRWRGVPTHRNMGGAVERPTAEHTWTRVAHALGSGADSGDAALDGDPPLDSVGIPWPIFASLLVANGWFLNPRGFQSSRHVRAAGGRLLAFVAGWVGAFVWLPTLPVAAALAAWTVYIAPEVRWVGQEFQQVEAPAP